VDRWPPMESHSHSWRRLCSGAKLFSNSRSQSRMRGDYLFYEEKLEATQEERDVKAARRCVTLVAPPLTLFFDDVYIHIERGAPSTHSLFHLSLIDAKIGHRSQMALRNKRSRLRYICRVLTPHVNGTSWLISRYGRYIWLLMKMSLLTQSPFFSLISLG